MTTLTAWLAFPAALFAASLLFVAAITAREPLRPRPTVAAVDLSAVVCDRDDDRDYSWSANPIHDELLAERFRDELGKWSA